VTNNFGRALAASVGAFALIGVGLSSAAAIDPVTDPNFQATFHIADAATAEPVTGSIGFEQLVVGILDLSDYNITYPIPAGATAGWVFVSPQGSESTPSAWNAKSFQGLTPGGLLLPNVSLTNQVTAGGGTPNGINAVKAAGGNYSIGLAFTKDNGINLIPNSLYFGHIAVTSGTGAWTYTETSGGSTPTPTPSAPGTATQNLAADVTVPAVVDGLLALAAPASTTSTIGGATIVNGKSTSTGTLGNFQVQDGRAASKPGWTLTTSSVGDFVNGATIIGKQNLGLAPKNVGGAPAVLGAPQVAGSATYPSLLAQMAAGTAGSSTLDADLTFVAPAGSPAGTYTSTLTVTLVSQ